MAKAVAKNIRMSPRKLRRVVNEIRGKDTNSAKVLLKFMPYAAARVVEKVLKSAVSNASQNEKLNPDLLKVTKAYVDQSTTLKRWRAMSRGRGFPILKKTSHVTLEVSEDQNISELRQFTPKAKAHKHHVEHKHDHKHDHGHDHSHDHDHDKEHKKKKTLKTDSQFEETEKQKTKKQEAEKQEKQETKKHKIKETKKKGKEE